MRRVLAFLCTVCACGQSGIEVPGAGVIVDSSGSLRQVQGVAGSFSLGLPILPGVLSAACSEQVCLAKTDSTIVSATGELAAPPGPAIFGFSGGSAILFFPEPRLFARWRDDGLEPLDWVADGEVLSVGVDEIAVRRNGKVSIIHPDGSLVDSIPEASGAVLLLSDGIVVSANDEVVLRRDGHETRFELAGVQGITAMGPHYVAIQAGDALYALRIEPGRESLFLLPGTTQ